ncbi:MAG: hypothetical protein H7138_23390 [Myxococcales bacterium]|nr:hypothetical protein [Myxococcales bacterium]
MLSELPNDAAKRDAVLDSANNVAGPEQRPGMTAKERKVETAAATAAAILGSMFSSTQSATLGSSTQFDENQLLAPHPMPSASPASGKGGEGGAPAAPDTSDPGPSNADLIPWIKLK